MIDLELHHDRRPRRDVADLLREEAGSFLLEMSGASTLRDGLLESLAGAFFSVDLTHDLALSDSKREPADGPFFGQRQLIRHPEWLGVRVFKGLLQRDSS